MWTYVFALYASASLVTFFTYGFDKRRARLGGSRIPEKTLHILELLGGWPGAYGAMRVFRHKTQKAPFRRWFFAIVALHVVAWGLYLWWRVS